MADERPHDDDRSAGMDVWLPAVVAIAAALFMIAAARAETAPPRAIYDESRFDQAAIAREAADVAITRAEAETGVTVTVRHSSDVTVVALPAIAVPAAEPALSVQPAAVTARIPASADRAPPAAPGWLRTLLPLGIAALLALALAGIARVWTRTEPSLA